MQPTDQQLRVAELYKTLIQKPCQFNWDDLWDEDLFGRCVVEFEHRLEEEGITEDWNLAKGPATWKTIGANMKACLPLWRRPGWKHELVGESFDLNTIEQGVLLEENGGDSQEEPDQRSRVVLLMLFIVGCKFCEPIFPLLKEIQSTAPLDKMTVLAVNFADRYSPTPEEKLRAYIKEKKVAGVMPYPVYWDPTRSVTLATATRTGLPFTPNCFLFVDGKLVWHGDPDPELEERSGFRKAIVHALETTYGAEAGVEAS